MTKPLKGLQILINAGPTREPIDQVRFISNHSSGKMGVALADAAANMGAKVHLVIGVVDIIPQNNSVIVTKVSTAESMASECISLFPYCDAAILSAAVADYTPLEINTGKMKKGDEIITLKLKPTIDIALTLGEMKNPSQIIAGFALETDDELTNAKNKLKRKNLDLVVLNSLKDDGAGFGYDTNKITIIDKYNNIDKFELKTKNEVATDILEKIVKMIKK